MEFHGVKTTIAFTGGGTGGHIYPGLAIAACIRKHGPFRLFWIGDNKGMDKGIVGESGLEFFGIPSGKLRRSFSLKNISDIFKVLAGFFAARKILKREKPALLFSKGGYVSVPPVMAAASLGIPVFAHESDLTPGLATRLNLRFVEKLFVPYNESIAHYSTGYRNKLVVSGNPVRGEFFAADRARGRAFLGVGEGEPLLLVLGGSSGSSEINGLIKEALPELKRHFTVVHQWGVKNGELPRAEDRYMPFAYFKEELPHIISAADAVICRGGAGTIWECAALKKPMIIIPLRGPGTRGDQVENAAIFEKAGAAFNYCDNVSASGLAALAADLTLNPEKLKSMAPPGILKTGAADSIAETILQKVGEQ